MVDRIQVVVVDNQVRARQSMKALLATWPAVGELREAANGLEALRLAEESQPDLVVMDVRMPEMNGIETTRLLKKRWPRIKIIVLSMYLDYREDALFAGADAFISKADPPDKLLKRLAEIVSKPVTSNQ